MAFVLFNLTTNVVGCDTHELYELDDNDALNEDNTPNVDYLDEIGYDLARDNADMYGLLDSEDEDESGCEPEDPFGYSWEILDKSREELEELYGDILTL